MKTEVWCQSPASATTPWCLPFYLLPGERKGMGEGKGEGERKAQKGNYKMFGIKWDASKFVLQNEWYAGHYNCRKD